MPGDEPSINETSAGVPRGVLDRWDALIALGLGLSYLSLLLGTVENLGYMRDEGFYFQAARVLESWLDLLSEHGTKAFEQGSVDRYFAVNHEHPLLMKLLFALSHRYLHERFGLFAEAGTAYRFPGMLMAVLAVVVVYLWGREIRGRVAGVVSALLLALMPRVFFHAHLACFDVPVAAMWLTTAYVFFRSLGRGPGWAIATGVLYGLLLDTKHNSWLLPFALVAHLVSLRVLERLRGLPRRGPLVPWALPALLVVGPLVFYALWPWIWFDTFERLAEYARFHLGHEYYNMEFLGVTYWKPPMPRLYAWVMTLATVPAITLVLFGIGTFDSVRHAFGRRAAAERRSARRRPLLGHRLARELRAVGFERHADLRRHEALAHGVSVSVPPRGARRCARRGTARFMGRLPKKTLARTSLRRQGRRRVRVSRGTAHDDAALAPVGPHLLHAARGRRARRRESRPQSHLLGLHDGRSHGRARRPRAAPVAVYVHDTALQSFEMFQRDGRLSPNLRPTLAIHASRLALYHHEPHMRRVEYEVWVDYGTRAPVAMGAYDGVPVAWLYERPRAPR